MTGVRRPVISITDPEQDRYSRLRMIAWWDQERLSNARVMVVGAGALGNEVIKNLALLGVGKLIIVDFDAIDISNLSRSVLFRSSDAHHFKADVAASAAREINPDLVAVPIVGEIGRDVGLGLVRRMDVVIGCVDSREARMDINRACWRVGRPWVDGGLSVLDGVVRVFRPPDSACYECTLSEHDYALMDFRYSCPPGAALPAGGYPTTSTAASIVAGMQVQEVVKLVHGLPVAAGEGVYYSGATMRIKHAAYVRREDCPAHLTWGPIVELPYRVSDMTIGFLLDLTRSHSLVADREILTGYACQHCGGAETAYRPYHKEDLRLKCPRCGGQRLFDVAVSLGAGAAGIPLSQLGIPPLAVVALRGGAGWQYVEFSGDRAAYPDFEAEPRETSG